LQKIRQNNAKKQAQKGRQKTNKTAVVSFDLFCSPFGSEQLFTGAKIPEAPFFLFFGSNVMC